MCERNYALAIGERMNYGDAFETVPEEFRNSITRQFNAWYASLSPSDQRNFLMLINIDYFVPSFTGFLCNKGGKLSGLSEYVEQNPADFHNELSLLLAMRVFDRKSDEAKRGVLAFFSTDGQRFAMMRSIARMGRELVHESMGRARKYGHAGDDNQEQVIANIVRSILAEFFGDLFKTLNLPALPDSFIGEDHDVKSLTAVRSA
jgi:hypothetical protein